MAARTAKYPPGAILDKGREIYDRLIRPTLEAANIGRLAAIDVDSEDYEIGDDSGETTRRLMARKPDAWVAVIRVGGGPVHRIGFVPRWGRP